MPFDWRLLRKWKEKTTPFTDEKKQSDGLPKQKKKGEKILNN